MKMIVCRLVAHGFIAGTGTFAQSVLFYPTTEGLVQMDSDVALVRLPPPQAEKSDGRVHRLLKIDAKVKNSCHYQKKPLAMCDLIV